MTPEVPAPAADPPSPMPPAVLYTALFATTLLVVAWLAALFLNGLKGTTIEFPEWAVTLVLGATVGAIGARYGGRTR